MRLPWVCSRTLKHMFLFSKRYVLAPWKRIFDNNTLKNDIYFPILLLFQIKVVSLPSIKAAETK